MPAPNTNNSMKLKVVVVGGGPAGASTALSLARQGHQVELFEAYPHPKNTIKNSPKAYVISLSKRGQQGLQQATGITPESVKGGVLSSNLARQPGNKLMQRAASALIAPRQSLTAHILDEAVKASSGTTAGIKMHYQHRLVEIDFEKRVATFVVVEEDGTATETKKQAQFQVAYDLLVGADGSRSKVRTLLHESKLVDDFEVVRTEVDSMEYQVAILSSLPSTFVESKLPANTVHAWNDRKFNAICLAFPLVSGGLLFAIVFPEGKLEEFQAAHKENGRGYDDALTSLFPNLDESSKKELIAQLSVGQPANGGLCVWTSSLGSSKHGVALVGDSGHGMWPSLGQGANAALESVAVFCQTCRDLASNSAAAAADISSSDLANAIVKEFDQRRHADAMAAVDLTFGGIGAKTSRGRNNAPLSFKLQVAGIMLLHKITLGIVPKPALLRVMSGENVPYSKAWKYNFFYEKVICLSALAAFTAPVAVSWYLGRK